MSSRILPTDLPADLNTGDQVVIVDGPLGLLFPEGDWLAGELATEMLEVGDTATYARPNTALAEWHLLKVSRGGILYDCRCHRSSFAPAP